MEGAGLLNALAQVATSVGLSATLILFFVWQGWKREERLLTRVEHMEDYTREILVGVVKDTTAAITDNTTALAGLAQALASHDAFTRALGERLAKDTKQA